MGVFGWAGLECSDCFQALEAVKNALNPTAEARWPEARLRADAEGTQRKEVVFIGFLREISAPLRLCGKFLMFLQVFMFFCLPRNFTPTH
jgi:hypothetical protein